jgi:YVTN family beta-propeller protein
LLLVANHLPNGRADVDYVAATVSVIDVAAGKVIKELHLPNGSTELNDIRISPDGEYAALTHIVAGFNRPATHVFRGWMNANALTIIDLEKMEVGKTVLLDSFASGAANPWGAAWSIDGRTLVVAHAGTHELSVIDFSKLLAQAKSGVAEHSSFPIRDQQANELPFLIGAHHRVKLPKGDWGPRAVVIAGNTAYVANYFSDTISAIDLGTAQVKPVSFALGPRQPMTEVRQGEFYFHDAELCLQGWQSCASCHPGGGRTDALNWDLLNDGIGNPKNTRSLLMAYQTPPAMSLGERKDAETAVRAGIKYILFSEQPDSVASAIDTYLKSLEPVPSPHLVGGNLSPAARRGEKFFSKAKCADCHIPGLYTDLLPHDVGTLASFDRSTDKFYTPTLIELWRTAPYLHDGSAATVRDVLTARNSKHQHGKMSDLSNQEVDDLCEYLLSL